MSRRVLVIDTDECMRELLRLHLEMAGYSAQTAADAITAGFAVLQSAPDLILCEVDLPHLDGLEFVAALRADPAQPRIPVIFVTANTEAHDRAIALGLADYLLKPLRADQLLAAVARRLPPRRPARTAEPAEGSGGRPQPTPAVERRQEA